MLPNDLPGWLAYIERLHSQPIDMSLGRVGQVYAALGLPKYCPIIAVGGTNGKGSTCAMLDAILRAAGYQAGTYTSPHLIRYNERVRIGGKEASDDALCEGFAEVERVRGDVPLTYFEFGTLAAWVAFARASAEVLVLEIGLGGRLDAVNLFDSDCAILTTVALDHTEYLGPTREAIGWEKAHIFRPHRPAICSDPEPPQSVMEHAASIEADLWLLEQDFGFSADSQQWRFWSRSGARAGLAYPALRGAPQLLNASAVLAALDALRDVLPVAANDVRRGLAMVQLPGRFQVLPGLPRIILDVAHNPNAAAVLAANLDSMGFFPRTIGVLGMLKDKDIEGVARALGPRIGEWLVASLPGPRGAGAEEVAAALARAGVAASLQYESVDAAFEAARGRAREDDRIVVFGSFLTVAAVMSGTGLD